MSLRLVTFDLDNTLWDVDTVIRRAEQTLRSWLRENVPEVVALYEGEGIAHIRRQVMAEHPELLHDLSRLRTEIIRRAIEATGRSGPESRALAHQAFDVFYEGRHQVHYFEHALEVLEELAGSYTLAALTNGNADFKRLGLDRFFSFGYCSADVGASKPAPDMFQAALKQAGVEPHLALHVGDHLHDDIHGAGSVGMHTVWVNLAEEEPEEMPTEPTTSVTSLDQLPDEIDTIRRGLAAARKP